ncbi:MAG: hypothetical protein H6624_13320 [Bdellovibrionaceae bacterium]|nr:hypothetical protein [Bdellovibrionales bacterium]MCB9085322.1 hypothetical protein [Pseudobdellovibrionaceae bacterium]
MNAEELRIGRLESLVEEMLKSVPCEKTVKAMMQESGIEYSSDPIERINLVLKALHFEEGPSETAPEKGL